MISSWNEIDGKILPLAEALRKVIGYQMGTLISCVHGRLAFYESEESKIRFVMARGPE